MITFLSGEDLLKSSLRTVVMCTCWYEPKSLYNDITCQVHRGSLGFLSHPLSCMSGARGSCHRFHMANTAIVWTQLFSLNQTTIGFFYISCHNAIRNTANVEEVTSIIKWKHYVILWQQLSMKHGRNMPYSLIHDLELGPEQGVPPQQVRRVMDTAGCYWIASYERCHFAVLSVFWHVGKVFCGLWWLCEWPIIVCYSVFMCVIRSKHQV